MAREIARIKPDGTHNRCPYRYKVIRPFSNGVPYVGSGCCMECPYNTGRLASYNPIVIQCEYEEKHKNDGKERENANTADAIR